MIATALPTGDRDLIGALRAVGGKVLVGLQRLAPGREPSDEDLITLNRGIVDVITTPGLDSDVVNWAFAFELLWPKRTVDASKLSAAVRSQLSPRAIRAELKVGYKAARAALFAFDVVNRSATNGRPRDSRAEAEAFLRKVAGYSIAEIAALTDPRRGGVDRVRHRVTAVVKAKAVPVIAVYSARLPRRKSVELTPSSMFGGPGTSETAAEVTSNARKRRKNGRKRVPSTR